MSESPAETLARSQKELIYRLASAAEYRRKETELHLRRVSEYCRLLGQAVGLSAERCELLAEASPLHDIGNICIPDTILRKAARHAPQDYEIMKQHASIGHDILKDSDLPLLRVADVIAWTHHEKYDGTGYPRGLSGENIPIEGRICAVADVFDALTTRRVYRKTLTVDEAVAVLKAERGKHLDPGLTDLFLGHLEQVKAVLSAHSDD